MMLEIFDLQWVENHLIYFAITGGIYIFYLIVKILWKIDRDIKKMDKDSKKSMIDYIRKTSKYNKDNKKKKLSFEEDD